MGERFAHMQEQAMIFPKAGCMAAMSQMQPEVVGCTVSRVPLQADSWSSLSGRPSTAAAGHVSSHPCTMEQA